MNGGRKGVVETLISFNTFVAFLFGVVFGAGVLLAADYFGGSFLGMNLVEFGVNFWGFLLVFSLAVAVILVVCFFKYREKLETLALYLGAIISALVVIWQVFWGVQENGRLREMELVLSACKEGFKIEDLDLKFAAIEDCPSKCRDDRCGAAQN